MPSPVEDLAELLAEADGMPTGLNVYPYPVENVETPALVIRPDEPWLTVSRYCDHEEGYLVVAVVSASAPADGISLLRDMSLAIMAAMESPFEWLEASGPVIDETTGVPFLANRTRVSYKASGGSDS